MSLLAVQVVAEVVVVVVAASVVEAVTAAAAEVVSAAGTVATLEVVLVSLTSMFPFPSISPVLVLRLSHLSCTLHLVCVNVSVHCQIPPHPLTTHSILHFPIVPPISTRRHSDASSRNDDPCLYLTIFRGIKCFDERKAL